METASILRSFHALSFSENPISGLKAAPLSRRLAVGRGLVFTTSKQRCFCVSSAKVSEAASVLASDAVATEKTLQGAPEGNSVPRSAFPNGFEALVLNVCDETSIAELQLKVGTFELHLKRDIGNPTAPIPTAHGIASPTTPPPIPSKPMEESAPAAPVVPQNSTPLPSSPFANVASSKTAKIAALEAAGAKSFGLVSSPTVGTFRSGRTVKGKKQPPSCKEGDIIKEGQVIGYVDQFGNELPIKSDLAGEVLKLPCKDGEPVGYGDPLVAVVPSFPGINK